MSLISSNPCKSIYKPHIRALLEQVRTLVQETGAGGEGGDEEVGESALWWVQHAQVIRGLPREASAH